jgi:hypothetical protein
MGSLPTNEANNPAAGQYGIQERRRLLAARCSLSAAAAGSLGDECCNGGLGREVGLWRGWVDPVSCRNFLPPPETTDSAEHAGGHQLLDRREEQEGSNLFQLLAIGAQPPCLMGPKLHLLFGRKHHDH